MMSWNHGNAQHFIRYKLLGVHLSDCLQTPVFAWSLWQRFVFDFFVCALRINFFGVSRSKILPSQTRLHLERREHCNKWGLGTKEACETFCFHGQCVFMLFEHFCYHHQFGSKLLWWCPSLRPRWPTSHPKRTRMHGF